MCTGMWSNTQSVVIQSNLREFNRHHRHDGRRPLTDVERGVCDAGKNGDSALEAKKE